MHEIVPGLPSVSRETFEKMEMLASLVGKWNRKINLVSRSTVNDIWTRHIQDSFQVFHIQSVTEDWIDIGSGAGFPGLVIGVLKEERSKLRLIESDIRKCAFLRTAVRSLGITAEVIPSRIEDNFDLKCNTLSARALASLDVLLKYGHHLIAPGGTAVFHKGENWQKEVVAARLKWHFDLEVIPSRVAERSVILKVTNIQPAEINV